MEGSHAKCTAAVSVGVEVLHVFLKHAIGIKMFLFLVRNCTIVDISALLTLNIKKLNF